MAGSGRVISRSVLFRLRDWRGGDEDPEGQVAEPEGNGNTS